jgi:hypothetical protein
MVLELAALALLLPLVLLACLDIWDWIFQKFEEKQPIEDHRDTGAEE